jgi:hypothetical protein
MHLRFAIDLSEQAPGLRAGNAALRIDPHAVA